jgi:hypothetical protein
MADKKISELPAVSSPNDSDEFPLARSGSPNTQKIAYGNLILGKNTLRPSGAKSETYSRQLGATNLNALTSQTVRLNAITLGVGELITSISFVSGTTALSTGVHQYFGLYDNSGNLLRATFDHTNNAWAASSVKTLNLTSTFTTTYAGFYYLAILIEAGIVPSLLGFSGSVTTLAALTPIIAGQANTGQTALPASIGTITPASSIVYAYIS